MSGDNDKTGANNGIDLGQQLLDISLNDDQMVMPASDGDNIGDTVFSKHWLFQCLINTVKIINGEKSGNDQSSGAVGDGPVEEPIEMDERSDEELSILWDMSTNEDVIAFLNDYKAIDLFETIILRTKSPRFAEISAGILANIAVNREVCLNLANRPIFKRLMLDSMSSSDTPFVLQVIRVMSTSLSNQEVQSLWLQIIKDNSDQFFQTIHHTLDNCLNSDLLKSEILLLNKILYLDDSIAQLWLTFDTRYECVKCLLEASDQLLRDDSDNIEFMDYLWLIVHTLSLTGNDFTETQLVSNRNDMLELFGRYICDSFGESVDYIIASGRRAGALSASISLINQLLCLSTYSSVEALFVPQMVYSLQQLHHNCDEYIKQLASESTQDVSYEMAFGALTAIQDIYREFSQKRLTCEDKPHSR